MKCGAVPGNATDLVLERASSYLTIETYHHGADVAVQVVTHRLDTDSELKALVHAEAVWDSQPGQVWLVTVHGPYSEGDDVHQTYFDGAPWPFVRATVDPNALHAGEAYVDLEGEQHYGTFSRDDLAAAAKLEEWVNQKVAELRLFYDGVTVTVSDVLGPYRCSQGGR